MTDVHLANEKQCCLVVWLSSRPLSNTCTHLRSWEVKLASSVARTFKPMWTSGDGGFLIPSGLGCWSWKERHCPSVLVWEECDWFQLNWTVDMCIERVFTACSLSHSSCSWRSLLWFLVTIVDSGSPDYWLHMNIVSTWRLLHGPSTAVMSALSTVYTTRVYRCMLCVQVYTVCTGVYRCTVCILYVQVSMWVCVMVSLCLLSVVSAGSRSESTGVYCVQVYAVCTGVCCVYRCMLCVQVYTVYRCMLCVQVYAVCTGVYCVYRCMLCVQVYTVCTGVCSVCTGVYCVQVYTVCTGACCVYRCILCVQVYTVCTGVYCNRCILCVQVYAACTGVCCVYRCMLRVQVYTVCTGVYCVYRCMLCVQVYTGVYCMYRWVCERVWWHCCVCCV